jgi:hypothetical protein
MTGSVIADRFEVVRVIGRGGNGAVCEVVDRTTGLPAALKVVTAEDADLAGRLDREGKALAMLAHPNIVALVDVGRGNDGTPHVATELLRGVSLRDVLDAGALAPRRALAITRQLLEALDHVHAAGMIHRDIKPENIMLVEGGPPGRDYVKLLDFGIAKVIDPNSALLGDDKLTRAGFEVLGSPPYIAPETAVGEPIDARTDLYSVGIVLFEMLAGRVPFHDDDRTTLLRKHVTDPVPPLGIAAPDGTPTAELEVIVIRALAKVPDQRFPTAMAMHAALDNVTRSVDSRADRGTSAVGRRLWDRAQHRARQLVGLAGRHPARFAAVVTGLVLVFLILLITCHGSSSTEGSHPAVAAPATNSTELARHWLGLAATELAGRRYSRAMNAYEQALVADRTLARDSKVRAAVTQIASDGDAVAGVIALEALATRLDPPDRKTIIDQASKGRVPEVRRRAFAIAERDGFAQSIDRFASWTLDLKQPATCDERRETITKLRDLGDPRAIETLQHARAQYACVAADAAAAIAQLQTAAQPR